MVPAPTTTHQQVLRDLGFLLVSRVRANASARECYYAPIDVILGEGEEHEVAQPDIVFVSTHRRAIITEPAI